jgi:arginine-tRNA-protein transferase
MGMRSDLQHERRTRLLADALQSAGPSPGPPFSCPYLPGRAARQLTILPTPLTPGVYHSLMDLNFRRLGGAFYRPQCDACEACRMIRIPVGEFRPSRAQRRCLARNRDLTVEIASPSPSEEKRQLYKRYLEARHDGQMDGSPDEFHAFLYSSPVATVEFVYRRHGELVGVGIVDVEPQALSAVYFYFEPDAASRSLGVFNVLRTIEECRRRGAPHLYLGYYVEMCRKMSYKASYRPCEILDPGGLWRRCP